MSSLFTTRAARTKMDSDGAVESEGTDETRRSHVMLRFTTLSEERDPDALLSPKAGESGSIRRRNELFRRRGTGGS